MIFHPFLDKWLQPGGHVESGESPLQAAMREVLEETGLLVEVHLWHQQRLMPFDIDVHPIPANPQKQEPEHLHFDFRYLFKATPISTKSSGEHQSRWRDLNMIKEAGLMTLVKKLAAVKT